MHLHKAAIGPKGHQFLREALASGNSLSRSLLYLPLEATGEVIAYKPEGVDDQAMQDPWLPLPDDSQDDVGGVTQCAASPGFPTEMQHRCMVSNMLYHHLRASVGSLCLFEDRATCPPVGLPEGVLVWSGPEWYFRLHRSYADQRAVWLAVDCAAATMRFMCVLADPGIASLRLATAHRLVADDLVTVAESTRCIAVQAYDFDGFIFWQRAGFPLPETLQVPTSPTGT